MPHLALYVLGPPRLERDGQPLHIARRKGLALLVYLVLTGREQRRDSLATLLWPDMDQPRARANLRVTLSSLKRALGEGGLAIDRERVALVPGRLWTDVDAFHTEVAAAHACAHGGGEACPDCLASLARAAELYGDTFLAGFTLDHSVIFDDWQFFQTEALRDELAAVLERLARGQSERGAFEPAIDYARRWVALDPLHEPAQRLLMRLLAASGRRAAALRQFRECQRLLGTELGVAPGPETTELYRAIKAGRRDTPAAEETEKASAPEPGPRHNLPVQLTPFIGREALLADIQARLAEPGCRLLTLVGPGGCGKTRLALEAAAGELTRFPDGVFFVSLAPVADADAVVTRLAQAVGFTFIGGAAGREDAEPRALLLEYLSRRKCLLVMDNFEHLLSPPLPSPPEGGRTSDTRDDGDSTPEGEKTGGTRYDGDSTPEGEKTGGTRYDGDSTPEGVRTGGTRDDGDSTPEGERTGGTRYDGHSPPERRRIGSARYDGGSPSARGRTGDTRYDGNSPPEGGREGGSTHLLVDILRAAPGVKLLVTSRAILNAPGEQLVSVPGMEVPAGAGTDAGPPSSDSLQAALDCDGIQLFLDRARRVTPDFGLYPDTVADVVHICRMVSGMPLAILMAAAWLELLSPAEIAAEIRSGLGLLHSDQSGLPHRQRSMCAVFDHSWNLLDPPRQAVLAPLSVFRGGFTRRVAARVAGADLHDLKALADRSLLQRGPAGRFEIHELLRQYGAERLAQTPGATGAARERHCAYFCGFLARREEVLKGPRQWEAIAEIEADIDNCRAAWDWAVQHERIPLLDGAANALFLFLEWRSRYREGEELFRAAAERLGMAVEPDALRVLAKVTGWQASYNVSFARTEAASTLAEQSLAVLDRPELAAHDVRGVKAPILFTLGKIQSHRQDYARAQNLFEESVALYRSLGDRWGTAWALLEYAFSIPDSDTPGAARKRVEESLAIRRELNDRRGVTQCFYVLSNIATEDGRWEEAERWARETVAHSRATGDMIHLAWGLRMLGISLCVQTHFTEAVPVLAESIALQEELGIHGWDAAALKWMSYAQMHGGHYAEAYACATQSLASARIIGDEGRFGAGRLASNQLNLGWAALSVGAMSEARTAFQASLRAFRSLGARSGQAFAELGLTSLATLASECGRAREHLKNALDLWDERESSADLEQEFPCVAALVLAETGEPERAVELYTRAARHPLIAKSRWVDDFIRKPVAAAAAALTTEVVAAAQARGRELDLDATLAELREELERGSEV